MNTNVRAWWSARSGLDGSLAGAAPAAAIARSGWMRSVGGVGPYLGIFARTGMRRDQIDAAVAALQIHELPSARGCTYVLPASDFALGLKLGEEGAFAALKPAFKLGVTQEEVEKLCVAVLAALNGPMDPDAIRAATGSASRSLGEEGKKKGVSTTLPLALGLLQARGEIRRVPLNGRLDQQRYAYVRWSPNPLSAGVSATPFTDLARKFFSWHGPATISEFQWFAGLGVKTSKEAVAPLNLVPVDGDRMLLPEDVAAFQAFVAPSEPEYHLVSSLDPLITNRRDLQSLLDPADAEKQAIAEKALIKLGSLGDLPSHAILDRGRVVGLWEYDPGREEIVWQSFVGNGPAAAVAKMQEFIRNDLGDARSFSLDSPASRAPRIAALRGG